LIALIALFVALGGTVYAASSINGKVITKGSIPANRLKPDSLTGAQVNEGLLGTVPSAAKAGEAAKAAEAAKATLAASATRATNADKATTATKADSATNATHATTADNATSAAALGGVGAASYQRSCKAGAVLGTARINPASTPGTGTGIAAAFSCAGFPPTVQHVTKGVYTVHFEGIQEGSAIVTATPEFGPEMFKAAVVEGDAPTLMVRTFFTTTGALSDEIPFTIMVM
jgi:hypothetical protein